MPWFVSVDTIVAVEGDENMHIEDVIAAAHEQFTFLLSSDLKPQFAIEWQVEYEDDGTGEPLLRKPSSPVGPSWAICMGCDHTWQHHDDQGCRWVTCDCTNPGERK